MGSVDAKVEIDMEILDDERESLKERAVAEHVVDGREVKHKSHVAPKLIDTTLLLASKVDSRRKRKRLSSVETSPSVQVEYRNLSKESRKKLQELLRDWSLWQGYHGCHSSSKSSGNLVESGKEQYYPALQVGPISNFSSVSFWMEKPAKQAHNKEPSDCGGIVRTNSEDLKEGEADVPLYDRVVPSLSTQESRKNGCIEFEREATRCFNCGSYSHVLKDCKRQWNYEVISSARSNHASKRTFLSGPKSVIRYYETKASNENQEIDRAPWRLHQTGMHGHLPSNHENEASKSSSGAKKKKEKNNMILSTEDYEEGEIIDDVGFPWVEEEMYIVFNSDVVSRADNIADLSKTCVPYNYVPEKMWRSPPPTYFLPSQVMHPNYQHQHFFEYPPQNPPFHLHTPTHVYYNGMNLQRAWDERQPQKLWEGRSMHYHEHNSSPIVNGPCTPIPILSINKKI